MAKKFRWPTGAGEDAGSGGHCCDLDLNDLLDLNLDSLLDLDLDDLLYLDLDSLLDLDLNDLLDLNNLRSGGTTAC